MKKTLIFPCAVLCLGLVLSLYQAANDYGLRTINLDDAVVAQNDETSGSSGGTASCNGMDIVCSSYLKRETKPLTATSNSEGTIQVGSLTLYKYKKNTTYTVWVADYNCIEHSDKRNACDSKKEGTKLLSISEGSGTSTSGSSTSGSSTSGSGTN